MLLENKGMSDVGIEFRVVYDIAHETASLKVINQTSAAVERGIKYHIVYEREGNRRISPPMNVDDENNTQIKVDILHGDILSVIIADRDGRHLAAAKIDKAMWPSGVTVSNVVASSYWLYVPAGHLI
jgi:hypothetical protein